MGLVWVHLRSLRLVHDVRAGQSHGRLLLLCRRVLGIGRLLGYAGRPVGRVVHWRLLHLRRLLAINGSPMLIVLWRLHGCWRV